MDMAKLNHTGNWSLLNSEGTFDGIRGIRGINESSPLPRPVRIVASVTCGINVFTTSHVPLHSLG